MLGTPAAMLVSALGVLRDTNKWLGILGLIASSAMAFLLFGPRFC